MEWSRAVDRVGQGTFLIVCVVLTIIAVERRAGPRQPAVGAVEALERDRAVEATTDLDPRLSDLTIVIAVNPGCVHCTRSMPLYRRVIRQTAGSKRHIRIVFATDTAVGTTQAYLAQSGVRPDAVVARPASVTIRGTPTLLIVNQSGKVVQSWLGELNGEQERALLRLVG